MSRDNPNVHGQAPEEAHKGNLNANSPQKKSAYDRKGPTVFKAKSPTEAAEMNQDAFFQFMCSGS